jgi:hypothetical protein
MTRDAHDTPPPLPAGTRWVRGRDTFGAPGWRAFLPGSWWAVACYPVTYRGPRGGTVTRWNATAGDGFREHVATGHATRDMAARAAVHGAGRQWGAATPAAVEVTR